MIGFIRRDRAVFRLASDKLAAAEREYLDQRAEQIIRSATRKAVVGALAAVSPGTDIVIQGYVGTSMTRALCRLYGAAPRDLDIEEFLSLSQSRVGKALPLTLAVGDGPWTWTETRSHTCSTVAADYGVDGTYSATVSNTATTSSTPASQ